MLAGKTAVKTAVRTTAARIQGLTQRKRPVALVIGVGRRAGIGAAIVGRLAEDGWDVGCDSLGAVTDPKLDELIDVFADAFVAGDRAAVDALLGPDFEFVSAEGRVYSREQRLAVVAAAGQTLARIEYTERRAREWGATAVLRAGFLAAFRPDADGVRIDRGVSSFTLLRGTEGWRICHQHNSHLEVEPPAAAS